MPSVVGEVHHRTVPVQTRERYGPDRVPAEPAEPARSVPDDAVPEPPLAGARHQRRTRRVAAGAACLLVAVAVAVSSGGGGGRDTRIDAVGTGKLATTAPAPPTPANPAVPPGNGVVPPTVAAVTTAVPPSAPAGTTPATTVAPAPAPAPAAAVPPAPAVCRNSADPACGPFRFDPQPAADRPMTLTVTIEPATVSAGTEVVFRVALNDPDGVGYNASVVDYGDGIGLGASSVQSCRKFGAWDPPAPGSASAVEVVEYRHVFQTPGTYTARFSFDAGPFDCTDATTGRGDRPFASSAAGEVTVVVVAP